MLGLAIGCAPMPAIAPARAGIPPRMPGRVRHTPRRPRPAGERGTGSCQTAQVTFPRHFDRGHFLDALWMLGVRPPVTRAAIVRAYREQVKQHHPDLARSPEARAQETTILQEINQARDYINAHLTRALDFDLVDAELDDTTRPEWTLDECVKACAEYERIWPGDPRD